MMNGRSAGSQKKGSLSLNDSPIEESIISQTPLPESMAALEYNDLRKKSTLQSKGSSADATKTSSDQLLRLREENSDLKGVIAKLSEDLRREKSHSHYSSEDLMVECQKLQLENDRFREQNMKQVKTIKELEFQVGDLRQTSRRDQNLIDEQRRELEMRSKDNVEEMRLRALDYELKNRELHQEVLDNIREIDSLNEEVDKLKKENVIDRDSRSRRIDQLRLGDPSPTRLSAVAHSRVSQFQLMDNERLSMRLGEKAREYEMLYGKYQSLENQFSTLEEVNSQLQRHLKLLEGKLSSFEIHTDGDEMEGELENKLVLMSTELMRLGNLNRTKDQEVSELTRKLKELLLRHKQAEENLSERDKSLLAYKQELDLLQRRFSELTLSESRARDDKDRDRLVSELQKVNALYKEKVEALKNADIKNAILEEKNQRIARQLQELERDQRAFADVEGRRKEEVSRNATKIMNQEAEIGYYKESNQTLRDDIKRVQFKVYQTRTELDFITKERDQLRSANEQAQHQLIAAQEDLRRVGLRQEDKEMELREIHHRHEQNTIDKNNHIKQLEEKLFLLEKDLERSSRFKSELPKIDQLLKDIQRLEGSELSLKLQITNHEQRLALLAQENERLHLVASQKAEQLQNLSKLRATVEARDKSIRDLSREVESLTMKEKRLRDETSELRARCRENIIEQRQSQSWQFKNRQLADELDALKTQLLVKSQEVNRLEQRYQRECVEKNSLQRSLEEASSKGNPSYLQDGDRQDREYFQREIRTYIEKGQRDSLKIRELEDSNKEHEDTYSTFSAQIMRLNQVLAEAIDQNASFKKEVDFLQHKVKACEQTLETRRVPQITSERSIVDVESRSRLEISEGKVRGLQGEADLLRQKNTSLREARKELESRVSQLIGDKSALEMRVNELQYQMSLKTESFRSVEDSFKLTILEIKSSNQRLQESLRQIEHHYISKLDFQERESEALRQDKKKSEKEINELEKKVSQMEVEFGSQLKEKNQFISTLSTNQHQTREEVEAIRRLKGDYQVKVALLSQEIQRLTTLKQTQDHTLEQLRRELRQNESKYVESMKDSSYHNRTVETLSQEIQRLNQVVLQNIQLIKHSEGKLRELEFDNSALRQKNEEFSQANFMLEQQAAQQRNSLHQKSLRAEAESQRVALLLEERTAQNERLVKQVQMIDGQKQAERGQRDAESSQLMKGLVAEMKLLREGNQNLAQGNSQLQQKLSVLTREYEQLVQQLEQEKRSKRSAEEDQKLRIITNYENTIKSMRDESHSLDRHNAQLQQELDRIRLLLKTSQEERRISEEKARVYQDKGRRWEQRAHLLEERSRGEEQNTRTRHNEQTEVGERLIRVMEEVARLQTIIQTKDSEIHLLNQRLQQLTQTLRQKEGELVELAKKAKEGHQQSVYYNSENINEQRGIFVISEASEMEERSRSGSGNNVQPQVRHPPNPSHLDLQHRYQLLQSTNKKLSTECECLRKKCVEYEFKMNKLKEEFDMINRLIGEYREQNQKLRESNKLLSQRGSHLLGQGQRNSTLMAAHSNFSSPQHSNIRYQSFLERQTITSAIGRSRHD